MLKNNKDKEKLRTIICMEYNFSQCSISNEKSSILIGNFAILSFLHIEFEILGFSTEIPSIQKRCEILGFKRTR